MKTRNHRAEEVRDGATVPKKGATADMYETCERMQNRRRKSAGPESDRADVQNCRKREVTSCSRNPARQACSTTSNF